MTYEEKLVKALDEAVYPQYGEWCKEAVISFIESQHINDSKEYIENKVFNPESSLYGNEDYNEYNPKNILGNINYNEYYNQSLCYFLEEDFRGSHSCVFFDLNKNFLSGDKDRDDILSTIPDEGDIQSLELLEMALNEIGVDGLREMILKMVTL